MNLKSTLTLILTLVLISCGTNKNLLSDKKLSSLNYHTVKGFYNENDTATTKPDRFPMYPQGLNGLMKDLGKVIRYPENARQKRIEGKVMVKYVIETDGSIKEAEVTKSVHKALDKEAIRAIKSLKKWYPGFKDNKPVSVEFIQPIDFKLK